MNHNDITNNTEESNMNNDIVQRAFDEYYGPFDLYNSTYKGTVCGPSVGFYVTDTCRKGDFRDGWHYCDDLYQLGTWDEMAKRGLLITSISVSSMVEGIEATTGTYTLPTQADDMDSEKLVEDSDRDPKDDIATYANALRRNYYSVVEVVDAEANDLWNDTHGCETCANHWHRQGIDRGEGCDGMTPVWPDCPHCQGAGEAF